MNRYRIENRDTVSPAMLAGAFNTAAEAGRVALDLIGPGQVGVTLPIAFEMRNAFNYYHVLTETFGNLDFFLSDKSESPIFVHLPSGDIKAFVLKFIDFIFPELAGRIVFDARPQHYQKVRSIYSHLHYLYSVRDASVDKVLGAMSGGSRWQKAIEGPEGIKQISMVSFDSSLRRLREAALRRMGGRERMTTPRLIWMERASGAGARPRSFEGGEALLEELEALGFERVILEQLPAGEQIEIVNGADIIVGVHGAGIANMMFAKPTATIIELGQRQTQIHRLVVFLKCAHVSQCEYVTVFADVEGVDDLTVIPQISKGLRGVRIGRYATDRVIGVIRDRIRMLGK